MFHKISLTTNSCKFLLITIGIIVCYTAHGILQEDIFKTKYGNKEENFHYFQVVCGICYLFSFILGQSEYLEVFSLEKMLIMFFIFSSQLVNLLVTKKKMNLVLGFTFTQRLHSSWVNFYQQLH